MTEGYKITCDECSTPLLNPYTMQPALVHDEAEEDMMLTIQGWESLESSHYCPKCRMLHSGANPNNRSMTPPVPEDKWSELKGGK